METQELEDNILIGIFAGGVRRDKWLAFTENSPNDFGVVMFNYIKYTTSFDWLMPVVEKCEGLGANIIIGRFFCEIKYQHPLKPELYFEVRIACGIKIKAIYGALVKFIEWYNANINQDGH